MKNKDAAKMDKLTKEMVKMIIKAEQIFARLEKEEPLYKSFKSKKLTKK